MDSRKLRLFFCAACFAGVSYFAARSGWTQADATKPAESKPPESKPAESKPPAKPAEGAKPSGGSHPKRVKGPPTSGILDGMKFEGTITMSGKKEGDPEKIEFTNGKMSSSVCQAKGYQIAGYVAEKQKDGTILFKANGVNPKDKKDRAHWNGTIKDGALEATIKCKKSGGGETECAVKAKAVKSDAKTETKEEPKAEKKDEPKPTGK